MTYPRKQRAGRPHLLVYSAEQAAIEAIQLDEVGTNVPAPIAKFLRTYQIEGIKFLYRQYASGKGGVLGDDMGLGKTIQVIGFLAAVMRESPFHLDTAHALSGKSNLPRYDLKMRKTKVNEWEHSKGEMTPSKIGPTCLIICPVTVIGNWKRELEKVRHLDPRWDLADQEQQWTYFEVEVYRNESKASPKAEVLQRFALGYLDIGASSRAFSIR